MQDPAFVWQQLAREGRPMKPPSAEPSNRPQGPATVTRWVTLHEAEEATGVPASTVRNWARKERIPTRFELEPDGQVRMVGLDEVVARARHLGRLRPPPVARPGPAPPQPAQTSSHPPPEAPEGSVLVPIDAWNRMINQLGNLHEAGQQLAEARERAARAETEAVFLRERLAEMRQQEAEAATVPQQAPVAAEPDRMEPQPQTLQEPAGSEPQEMDPAWLYLYRRWENRSRKRKR
jgi:hypothetical protein